MDCAISTLLNGRQQGRLTSHQFSNPSQSSNVVTIPDADLGRNATGAAITKLEDILVSVQESLNRNEEMSIPYRCRPSSASQSASSSVSSRLPRSAVRFPGRTVHEATKFSASLDAHLADVSRRPDSGQNHHQEVCSSHAPACLHRALLKARKRRSIYYQDEHLFKQQSIVDNLVDDLAYTLGLGREDLGIVATSKGLVAGPILIRTKPQSDLDPIRGTPSELDASSSATVRSSRIAPFWRGWLTILGEISQIDFGPVRWVLVIEKDATFRTLAARRYYDTSTCGSGILITGKGYPDLVTKQFLHLIHDVKPELPILALVDYDYDGIAIMRCYSHGSRGHAHERNTVVPSMAWLGIKSGDLAPRQEEGSDGSQRPLGPNLFEHSSSITRKDRKSAARLISGIDEDGTDYDIDCRRELQVMLFLGAKAEIQAVDDAGDTSSWLDSHMKERLFTS
ncbi:Type IIB DNA topoisomerase [Colletotrichum higginsianum IMI 349063]|uniref:DNA topoisomerase (ATP-hydrolyzing) n=1 Tax=Colletotrichum higginsianum (strain IMI 349063) TaxID=759273 RepID=A0A1B7YHW6_COLHI|nr:Type IIB DNA topoisomerase [Colletotrichum higginsianum IMI 349063]OBR11595.1 Type IIB DNA topoisomerase [Colletotrichum higginsianum IMI 349063]